MVRAFRQSAVSGVVYKNPEATFSNPGEGQRLSFILRVEGR